MKKNTPLLILVAALALGKCTNIGLLDQIENPGKSTSKSSGTARLYVFAASVVARGDMKDSGGASLHPNCNASSNIGAADCACQNFAQASGRITPSTRRFVAWLSSGSADMTCRIQDVLSGVGCALPSTAANWYNTQEQLVADSFGRLFSGQNLINAITYTETGTQANPGANVWTATTATGGAVANQHCNNWADASSFTGVTGTVNDVSTWTVNGSQPTCNATAYIYCFGIP